MDLLLVYQVFMLCVPGTFVLGCPQGKENDLSKVQAFHTCIHDITEADLANSMPSSLVTRQVSVIIGCCYKGSSERPALSTMRSVVAGPRQVSSDKHVPARS
jgi:hypothetical protein